MSVQSTNSSSPISNQQEIPEQPNIKLQSLQAAILKKLNSEIKFGNFFNGIHNRIANLFNKKRTVTLQNLQKTLTENEQLTDAKLKNLPKSIREHYEKYIASKQNINTNNAAPSQENKKILQPKISFGNEFESAAPKTKVDENRNFKKLWENRNKNHIGKGSFGTVYASNDNKYVFKVINNEEAYNEDSKGNTALFSGIKSQDDQAFYTQGVDFVTKYCGTFESSKNENVLIFERAPGIEFAEYLKEVNEYGSSDINDRNYTNCTLLAEAATAIAIAHEAGCVNRDIKPKNIMVGQQKEQDGQITATVKLIDQGLVYNLKNPSDSKETICGTSCYLPPEMVNNEVYNNGISPAADVFSLGVMCMETLLSPLLGGVVKNFTLEGRKVFNLENQQSVYDSFNRENFVKLLPDIVKARQDLKKEKGKGKETVPYEDNQLLFLGSLLKDCLAQNPAERPSAAQVGELLQIFSASIGDPKNLIPYDAAKKMAEEDRPKAIPIAIRDMISNKNLSKKGFKALDALVKADPSYENTPSYGLAMLYKDKFSIFNIGWHYKAWAKKYPNAAKTLKERVNPGKKNLNSTRNIPVSQEFYKIIQGNK